MTKSFLIAVSLLSGLSLTAVAEDRRYPPSPTEAHRSVLPTPPLPAHAADHIEARNTIPLRESLRLSWGEADDKPYRLSSEERQRMREQLRAQSAAFETPSK